MFLYREHRGSLVDSMRTVKEMSNFSELENYIQNIHGEGEITVKEYCYDERIKWNTHIVCLDGTPVGFTDSHVEKKHEQIKKSS